MDLAKGTKATKRGRDSTIRLLVRVTRYLERRECRNSASEEGKQGSAVVDDPARQWPVSAAQLSSHIESESQLEPATWPTSCRITEREQAHCSDDWAEISAN